MGYGNYSHEAHEAMIQGRSNLPRQEVFKQRQGHPLMNPKGVRARESRDNDQHPNSLGIVFALDVTGSMGGIPDVLARRELPKFMRVLMECGVADPQVLFMAVGDALCDQAPLQVGQFETTGELMDQWLTWSFLEGGGGGNGGESYELAIYFAAQHTAMDCFEKRKKRGILILTGDDLPFPAVSKHQVEAVVGDRLDDDVPTEAIVAAAQKTFDPFFLIPDQQRRAQSEPRWRQLLGDHVICMESPDDTCYVAAGLVALREGVVANLDALAAVLSASGADPSRIGATIRALTPYAATLGCDGAASPHLSGGTLPNGGGSSGMQR